MASIKTAYSPEVNTETFVNGALAGAGIYGIAQAIKKIQDNRRMRRQLAKLEALTQDELAKDDISIAGDFFKDKYTKQAADGLHGLPGWAWLLTGAGAGYAGSGIIHELLSKKRPAQTPSFAVEYKKQRQKEFERAARLLRAVTDAPTWKDVANSEKMASLRKEAGIKEFANNIWENYFPHPFRRLGKTWDEVDRGIKASADAATGAKETVETGKEEVKKTGEETRGNLNKFFTGVNDYALPAIYAAAIAGTGYLGYKALNKLLYAIRKYKNRASNDDAAANAWLAQRKDLGEPGKVLNTYIENDDSEERKELNKLLAAYESRYKA